MNCTERTELLTLYAAGALESGESDELRSHLASGCPKCAGALAEAEALLAHLPLALDPVQPSPEVRERLLARAAAQPGRPSSSRFRPRTTEIPAARAARTRSWFRPALAAALGAAASLALWPWLFADQQAELSERITAQAEQIRSLETHVATATRLQEQQAVEIARLEASTAGTDELQQRLQQQASEIERLTVSLGNMDILQAVVERQAKEIERLRLSSDDALRAVQRYIRLDFPVIPLEGNASILASGRIFWDKDRGTWDFYVSGLAPAALGRTYELWFITENDRKIPAGTFDVDVSGRAELLRIVLPTGVGRIAVAAVTDEPFGGSLQPTGKIQLSGGIPLS